MRAYRQHLRDLESMLVSLRCAQFHRDGLTSGVSGAVEDNGAVLVLLCA